MKKILLAFAAGLFVLACAKTTSSTSSKPTGPDLAKAQEIWPGTTAEELAKGEVLYSENCRKCHGLKKPGGWTEEQWRKIMPPMAKKAKIDSQTENTILKYVVAMSYAERK